MSNLSQLLDDVYSSLDNGQYEKALQLCLKPEVNRFTLGKALLSYTYACLRNNNKAMEVARMVASAEPSEESVISTLGCTFKHIRAESDFAKLYETALKKKSLPESYVIELFSCYCRLNDPKKMQFVAQKLHKATPDKHSYLFWSITCMMLQDLPPTIMVLAEKMAFKVLYELSPLTQPSAEEMSLYALILAKQNKLTHAFDAIVQLRGRAAGSPLVDEAHFAANPNFVKMLSLQVSVHKIDLLVRQGRLEEVIQEGKHVLASFPDQWNVHSVMVDCLLQQHTGSKVNQEGLQALSREKHMDFPMQDLSMLLHKVCHRSAASNSDVASLAQNVLQYHAYLQQLQAQYPKLRGPYLAEMRLLSNWISLLQNAPATGDKSIWALSEASAMSQAAQTELTASPLGRLVLALCDLISKFALRFQTKQCCFSDLKPYLTALASTAQAQTSLNALRAWAVEQRVLANQRLFEAVSAVTDAKTKASASQKDDIAQSVPPVPDSASGKPPTAPTAATVEAEEGGEEDEDGANVGKDASTSAVSAAPSVGGKKKKNKRKKKSSSAVAAATAALSAVELAEKQKQTVEEFTEVLLPLCAFIKIDQIVAYCDTLLIDAGFVCSDSSLRQEDEELQLRLAVYAASREIFGKGVGGEARNVQPGDELVLQNSALYRRRFVDTRAQAFAQSHGVAVQWAKALQAGLMASPYGSTFKADVLEPYRALAMGEAAAKSYTDMGPRHIQHDSLSYLVFPALLESACFAEAARNMRAVVNHHTAGRRDSLDMMGRAFQYGNYMRALELSRFVDICHRSTQLRLCKAELPIMEVILKHPTLATATKYLGDLMENRLPESLELQEAEQQSALVDHMDFHLQVRTDQQDGDHAIETARLCRLQMLQRLSIAQLTTRMLFYATLREGDEAMEHFEQLQRSLVAAVPTACSPAHPYQLWDQSVSRGDGAFGAALAEVSAQTTRFLLASVATNTATMFSPPSSSSSVTAVDKPKPAGFLSLESAAASALSAMVALFSLKDAIQSTPVFLDNSEDMFVSPQWLRNVTAFVRTVGTELSLLVQVTAAMHSARPRSFRDSCGAKATLADCEALLRVHTAPTQTADAQLGALVAIISEVFLSVLDLVHSRVENTSARLTAVSLPEFAAAVSIISSTAVHTPSATALTTVGGVTQVQYEEARRAMAASANTPAQKKVISLIEDSNNAPLTSKSFADAEELHGLVCTQIASSHREACTRLAGLLLERIDAVRSCLQ